MTTAGHVHRMDRIRRGKEGGRRLKVEGRKTTDFTDGNGF